jgi:hypothetical protein
MIYNTSALSDVEVLSTVEENDITLDKNAKSIIFQMFSKNIYSNPIGSVVREITSNCFDSHVEAKVKAPVVIRRGHDKETDTHHISFIDYGVGMSPDRMRNIFSVMFSSTKRNDNEQIGAFGLGSKTPLAYKRSTGFGQGEYDNSYFIVTNFNHIKYVYQIYEGTNLCPKYSLLHEEPTTERNGTEVRIPVLVNDLSTFSKEMVRQLYYFENVIFEGFENDNRGEILTNQYQIIRGKTFLYRGKDYSDYMHVCLGRVAYPLDYNALGLNAGDYRLPIALRLEVGDIGVTVSRESLDYSESTIKMLKKKLEEVKDEIKQLIAKQYEDITGLEQYFNVKNNFGMLKFGNGGSMYVGNLIKQSDVDFSNFKYSFMKMPSDKVLFKLFFNVKTFGKVKKSRYNSNEFEGGYSELKQNQNLFHVEEFFDRKVIKQAYLNYKYSNFHIISRRDLTFSSLRQEICEVFNVHLDKLVDDYGIPIKYVQDLIVMQDEYFEIVKAESLSYDNLEIPEDFIEGRKGKRGWGITAEMRNTTIPAKFFCHYSKSRILLDELFKYNFPIFYGSTDDESKLAVAQSLFANLFDKDMIVTTTNSAGIPINANTYKAKGNKGSIMFIMVSQANVKYLKYCKNAYHVDEFKHKMLYRKEDMIMNYFRTYRLKERWENISSIYSYGDFGKVDAEWGNRIEAVRKFVKSLPKNNSELQYRKYELQQFYDLNNIELLPEHKQIGAMLDDIETLQSANAEILRYISANYGSINSPILVDILKKVMVL